MYITLLMIISVCLTGAPGGQGEVTAQYDWGWCTWWVHERASQTGWALQEFPEIKDTPYTGDAYNWGDYAQNRFGYTVDHTPMGGSVAVFQAGCVNAGGLGHVAFVERVNANGSIEISEANFSCEDWEPKPCGKRPNRTIYPPFPDCLSFIHPNHPIVYEHANYAGNWSPFPNPNKVNYNDLYNQNFSYPEGNGIKMGDKISSIWIPPGWSLELWRDKDFGGTYRRMDNSDNDFAGDKFYDNVTYMNDSVSSIRLSQFSCINSGAGMAVAGITSVGEQVGHIVDGQPVRVEIQISTADVTAQAYSGICGTGPSNPSNPSNPPSAPDTSGGWQLSFYNNEGLSYAPVWTGSDGSGSISHNWGSGSPASGVNSDHFSARWERDVNFASSGDWKFTIRSDDGFRIFIDGQLFSQEWWAGWHDISPTKYLTAGVHRIRLDYFEVAGDAKVEFWWSSPPNSDGNHYGSWYAEWFNWDNLDPSHLVSTSWESAINYDWGTGNPGHGLGADNFSVRWTGTFNFPENWFYKFPVKSDDGFKLWIDGQLVGQEWSEGWHDVAPDRRLSAGNHTVVFEYFEKYDNAKTKLSWYKLPPDTTAPTGEVIQPIENSSLSTNVVKICAKVDDGEGVGLNEVQFHLYHKAQPDSWQYVSTDWDGRDGWCATWNHTNWPDEDIGTHLFVFDRAGNMFSGGGKGFKIDRTAPTGSFASPTNGATITGDSLTVRVNAADNWSGVDRVEFQGYYDAGNSNLGWWPMTVDSDGSDSWGFTWDLSDLPTQAITVRATIYDKAGNSRVTEVNNVTIHPLNPDKWLTIDWVGTTEPNGVSKTTFYADELIDLRIRGKNFTSSTVASLWDWETTNPDGSQNQLLSWSDFAVNLSGTKTYGLLRVVPSTPGTYRFTGRITWGGNNQYSSQATTTFTVILSGTQQIFLPIIQK